VNKVATKVELLFEISASTLNEQEKQLVKTRLTKRIQRDGALQIICQQDRSQLKNKELAQQKLLSLINQALKIPKIRRKTKPSKKSNEKRLADKRHQALLKIG